MTVLQSNTTEVLDMDWMLCVVCAVFGVLMILAAGCVVAAWRLGLRDGMRAAEHKEPEPMLPEPVQKQEPHPPDSLEPELEEQLKRIENFDGWK